MKRVIAVSVIVFIACVSSCGMFYFKRHGVWFKKDISNNRMDTLHYSELPDKVKNTFKIDFEKGDYTEILCVDSTDNAWHYLIHAESNHTFLRKYGHRIVYNGKSYFIEYKRPLPFVMDDSVMYFSKSLQTYPYNYHSVEYIRLYLGE